MESTTEDVRYRDQFLWDDGRRYHLTEGFIREMPAAVDPVRLIYQELMLRFYKAYASGMIVPDDPHFSLYVNQHHQSPTPLEPADAAWVTYRARNLSLSQFVYLMDGPDHQLDTDLYYLVTTYDDYTRIILELERAPAEQPLYHWRVRKFKATFHEAQWLLQKLLRFGILEFTPGARRPTDRLDLARAITELQTAQQKAPLI